MPAEMTNIRSCEQVIFQSCASRIDLKDHPLSNPEEEWYTDGST